MKKSSISVMVLCLLVLGIAQPKAQTTSTSSTLVAQPVPDRTVSYRMADSGLAKPIIWGMDAGGWTNPIIWATGVNYLGTENLRITRIPAFPTDTLYGDTLQQRQKNLVKERLDQVSVAGHPLQIMLNPGGGEIAWYSRDAVGYARYARLMELTKNYIEQFGHTVVSVTGYNEPDYWASGVSQQNFFDLITACKARPGFNGLRFCGGNTLNNDFALDWYNFVRPAGLTEGNTHQLAGIFDTYANFYQTVRANGHYATNDEVHNIMEGIVGAQYGMQAGIYWGYASLARGEFTKACNGRRLGYAEHRPNWTAAAVYRKTDGQVQAFGGASERQAATTTYRYVSRDRDVYYEGYGPQREYSMVIPGGNGYGVNQYNAERVVNISWGEDIQPAINGRYVLVNRLSGKVLEVPGGAPGNGVLLQQNGYSGAAFQQWHVLPVNIRSGGDFSYFTLTAAHNGKAADLFNYSLEEGAGIGTYDSLNGGNQQYYFDYVGDGYFYIRNRHSSKCLEVQNGATTNGAAIVQMSKSSRLSQQWRLLPIGAAIEFVAPGAPTNLVATARAESVLLSWTASPQSDVAGYHLYRSESATGPFNTIARQVSGTSFVDNTTTINGTYFYKIKAADRSLNRSDYSNQVSATTTGTKTLVAHLPFDGNTRDTSVNLNHSAFFGTASYGTGKTGTGAVELNGSNQFIQLPATVANQQEITVATWVYWNGGNAWQRIFDFGNDESQNMFLTPNAGGGGLRFAIKNGGTEQQLNAAVLPTGTWVHVAVTLGAAEVRMYVNGQTVARSTGITIRPLDFKPVLNYIGRSQYPDPTFNGRIDEFRIYNYALSAIEVAELGSANTYYQVRNRTSGLFLDGIGRTNNGDNCGQWANTTHVNAQWDLIETDNGYYQLKNRGTGLFLDGMGRTANGAACGQWGNTAHPNAQWELLPIDSLYYQLRNRTTGLYLDGLGLTNSGADVAQWANTTNTNAQWTFVNSSSNQLVSKTAATPDQLTAVQTSEKALDAQESLSIYPNPVSQVLHIQLKSRQPAARLRIYSLSGQVLRTEKLNSTFTKIDVSRLTSGVYMIELTTASGATRSKFVKQ